ncbi:hypothetical protein [Nitratidesulfovibrio sp. 1201_IL3209]|uniref:hypothetical protein n=1 Tax=Nitratidesulfovibrio sp. 1201_IL3209 TaxID=3084053 RepID=UPI002FD9DC18
MAKCPNCEKCIADLRSENARLRERLSMAREFAVGRLHVVWRADGMWSVGAAGRMVLSRDGRFEYELHPSDRDEAFLARTRYTLDEALDVALALVEREAKECKACCGSGVRDDGRWGGIADTTPCSECNGTGVAETDGAVEKCECGGKGA